MFCPKCGTQSDDRAAFCPNCGVALLTSSSVPQSESVQQTSSGDEIQNRNEDGRWWAEIPSGHLNPVFRATDLKTRSTLAVNDKGIIWGHFGTSRILVPWTELREIQVGELDRSKGSQRSAFGFGPVGLAFVAATAVHNSRAKRTVHYQVIRVSNLSGNYVDFATPKSRVAVVKLLGPTANALVAHFGKATREPEEEAAHSASAFSVADELEKLVKLRDSGVLSKEEFGAQKVRLLAQ